MSARCPMLKNQRGVALVTSLLLLLIVTIIALSMFRSFAVQEHVAGNLREKERALHAATSAQQYGEWWLLQGNNAAIGPVACQPGTINANANANAGQICLLTLPAWQGGGLTSITQIAIPWPIQVAYAPPGMCVTPCVPTPGGDPGYAISPAFYITDLGRAGDNLGEAYQVDAYGSGSTALTSGGNTVASATVAIVESTYEVQQGVNNLGGQ
jgi:type IV pilus assembly protein PilX